MSISYKGFAVANAYQRMMMDLNTDDSLKMEIVWLERKLSCVKADPLCRVSRLTPYVVFDEGRQG